MEYRNNVQEDRLLDKKRIAITDLHHILSQTQDSWDAVRGKTIFITGGTGFFGKWLLESFVYINQQLQLNASVTVLTRDPERFLSEFPFYKEIAFLKFLKGDIQTFEFPAEDYHYIIHAATEADAALNSANPLLMVDTITQGTRRVLDLARQKSVESFLFTSSGAIYGRQPSNVTHVKENDSFPVDILNPNSAYLEGKRVAELYCSIYYKHYRLPVKIARCFAFVGPYLPLDKHFAIGNFILNSISGQDIIIKGDGTPYRSYLYAADLTVWLWVILFKGEALTAYNVGSDEDYDLNAVANTVAELNRRIKVKVLTRPDREKPVERYVPDVNFIKEKLGVKISFNLKEAIEKTQKFYTKDEVI